MDHIDYSIQPSRDITDWQETLEAINLVGVPITHSSLPHNTITDQHSESIDEDDLMVESSISLKDLHMIHTFWRLARIYISSLYCQVIREEI